MLWMKLTKLGFKSRFIFIEKVINQVHIVRHSLLEISRSKVKVIEIAFNCFFSIIITANFQLANP